MPRTVPEESPQDAQNSGAQARDEKRHTQERERLAQAMWLRDWSSLSGASCPFRVQEKLQEQEPDAQLERQAQEQAQLKLCQAVDSFKARSPAEIVQERDALTVSAAEHATEIRLLQALVSKNNY